ncbi:MAG: hypothetical protein CFE21_21045 [Bacteroidetes bacterium B1(2017)]|nr:MAG: hypothetical protein CFE21_21045 [Bacteroidetes bacterium B1(2017)]
MHFKITKKAILSALIALRIGEKYDIFRIKKNALKNLDSIYTVKGDFKKALMPIFLKKTTF